MNINFISSFFQSNSIFTLLSKSTVHSKTRTACSGCETDKYEMLLVTEEAYILSTAPSKVWVYTCWDCRFESRRQHGCLSLVSVVSLRRADHSSRVLPSVNAEPHRGGLGPLGPSSYDKKINSSQTAGLCINAPESLLKSNFDQMFCPNLEKTEESYVKKQEVTCKR